MALKPCPACRFPIPPDALRCSSCGSQIVRIDWPQAVWKMTWSLTGALAWLVFLGVMLWLLFP